MKCPYCVENIKDEAIVCPHCRRDLAFFAPVDNKLKAIDAELAVLKETVTKMAAFLDRQQDEGPGVDGGGKKIKKPAFWQKLLVAFFQFVLLIALFAALYGMGRDLRPAIGESDEQFIREMKIVFTIMAGLISLVPIGLGLWAGMHWHGRHLRHYLSLGLLCGLFDGAILSTFVIRDLIVNVYVRGDVSILILIIAIDTVRCMLGFATGGLLGDWIERRRYPSRYGKGFGAALAASRQAHAHGFDRITIGFGKFASAVAPILPLIGTIITSVFGLYAAIMAVKPK